MKLKHCMLALALTGLVYSVSPVFAQDTTPNQQSATTSANGPHGHMRFDPEQRTQMLTRQLKLTSDQQSKVLEIFKSAQSQAEALHSDTNLNQQDRRAKMMDIHKSVDDQIRGVLDSQQQQKWDAMQARRQQWMQHRGAGQAPNSPDSSEQK